MSENLSTFEDREELFALKSDVHSSSDKYDPLQCYKASYYNFINDSNNNNYNAGRITFDTISTLNQFVVWSDAYLRIPLEIKAFTSPAGATVYAEGDGLSFKNSILDLITGVLVQSGSGETLENSPNSVALINKIRMLLETSLDGVQNLNELDFEPDTTAQSYTTSKGNWLTSATGRVPNNLAVDPASTANWNEGFSQRIKIFKQQASFAANTFSIVVYLGLGFISRFFRNLDFPICNARFLLTFYTPVNNATTALTVNTPILHSTNNAAGAAMSDAQISISNTVRLYYKRVEFDPSTSAMIAKHMSSGFKKRIQYDVVDLYNTATSQASAIGSASVEEQITPSVVAPTKVWRIATPAGCLNSQTVPFSSITPLSSVNLNVNNVPYYQSDLQTDEELYEILRSNSLSASKLTRNTAGLISYNDWVNFMRIHCFDLSRLGSRLADPNQACSLYLRATRSPNLNAGAADVYYLVEHSQVCDISFSNSDVKFSIAASYL